MDAFFAAVEVVRNPALAGKPLIIGGTKEDRRGVVSTASYEARHFGVHSAMPLTEAIRLCPQGIFMRGNTAYYQEASAQVRAILETVTPEVQMASIDEAYLDVTGSQRLFGGDDAIAAYIKSEIRAQTGLPCTIAITPNKLISKVGSDYAKPNGYLRVGAGEERAFLAPLSVKKLPGAGPRTCTVLTSLGIVTVGELATAPLRVLERAFGVSAAVSLQRMALGVSNSVVETAHVPKSISRETTFPKDVGDWAQLERMVAFLTERCAYALREEGMEAKRVTLKVRYGDFETKTFAKTLEEATSVDSVLAGALQAMLPKGQARRAPVRLIGVAFGMLRSNQHQTLLFDGSNSEKWEQVLGRVDGVRHKLGFEAVRSGRSLGVSRRAGWDTSALSR